MSRRVLRINDAAGYLLHATAWKETSLILQAFTRDYGAVALVAKGAKRPQSALRSALSIFQPVRLSWTGNHDIKTLAKIEPAGILPLAGKAWMSAWYMNELLLRLLPREDAHDVLFDAYDEALRQLAQGHQAAGALRRFEWTLLTETGYGLEGEPDFDDPAQVVSLRQALRARLDYLLAGRPLNTRAVLMALQKV